MEKATRKDKHSRWRGEKKFLFTPSFREVFFYEIGLLVGLISLFLAGAAWPVNNPNSTRIETGPTASFAIANPFPAADLIGGKVMVQMRAGAFKQGSYGPCQTERLVPVPNIQPVAGQVILIQPIDRPFASNLRPIILISSKPKT